MKKQTLYLLRLVLFFTLIIQACKKDEIEHPELKTIGITAISSAKVRVVGKVVNTGKYKISDYGFVYSLNSSTPDIQYGTKASLGSEVENGEFSKDLSIAGSFNYERTIYARAYLTNEKGTAYGDVISVKLPVVSTNGLAPSSGKAGDKITISGSFSGLSKDDVSVMVGNVSANIESLSSSQLVFVVPSGINTSNSYSNQVSVTLVSGGQSTTVSSYFTLRATFNDFSPKAGAVGSTLSISGNNISSNQLYNSNTRIYFGSIYSTSYNVSSGILTVAVPSNITSDKFQIAIETDGIRTTLPGEFTLTHPTISSLSANALWPGSPLTIYGNNFYYSYHTVSIGNIGTSVNYTSSTTQLSVNVPSALTAGEHVVKIHSGATSVSAPSKLTIKEATFTGFSPSSGSSGREITLNGEFNPYLSYNVYFGTYATSAYSLSSNSMKVTVPSGLDAGDLKISVRSGTTTLSTNGNFTVLAPSITSISPTSGVAGSIVTITGNGFSTYSNTVKFGTTSTPSILSATESTLRVLVPSNLTPGAMKISVTTSYGQTVVSPMNFTVTNQ